MPWQYLPMMLPLIVSSPLQAAEVIARILDQKGNPVENAVLLAVPEDKTILENREPPKDEIDQIDKDFVPHVKVILEGTRVYFPNKDDVRHHVYSFSPAKIFELPLYSGTPADPIVFDTPGQVTLGCNIHDWMLGYIYIADTPFYGKSSKDGEIYLSDLPEGDYALRVWHPSMKVTEDSTIQQSTLSNETPQTREWRIDLKPVFRIPRASGSSGSLYGR